MKLTKYDHPNLAVWSPLNRLSSVRDVFDNFWNELPAPTLWAPALDLREDEDGVTVNVELPGMKREDFEISLQDGNLRIAGEKKSSTEQKEGSTYRSERFYGRFERALTLPVEVDGSKVTASYRDGVLTVSLPKAEQAKPKKIDVAVAE